MGAPSMETTFRYKYAWVFCAWTVAVDGVVLWIVAGLIREGRAADAAFVSAIFLVSISSIGWFLIASRADVVVSETGLSRRLWGRTLAEMSWKNVKKIRVCSMYHQGYRRSVRVFWIFPVRPSRFRFTRSGTISFDEPSDMSRLIEDMNRHIAAHGIPVEVQIGTSWTDPASWHTRTRIDPTPAMPP